MLYERWRDVANRCGSQVALHDLASGRRWTFGELASASEQTGEPGPLAFPQGPSADFVISVLRAWRAGQVVCPLETDQVRPSLSALPPAGIVHLKVTSATGGVPRMVAFTGEQLAADADNIVATMGLRADWPNLAAISLAHSYGFSNLVLPLLLHGVPMVLAWSALPEAVRTAAAGMRDVTLAAVPALWRAWHEARAIPPQTRLAISAGAPLPLELEQQVFADTGLKIHNFYGSTECGGIAYDTGSRPREDAFTIGKPMRNVSLALAENGCLEVRSAAVGWGYWPDPAPSLGGGVFRTMDLCEMTTEGVRVLGRAGDQINVAGCKLSPETVEAALSSHPGVRACLVFGVPSADLGRGDMVVACVSAQTALSPEDLKQYALSRLPAWQVPREWWFVDSLPVNARGKLPRVEWRERYLKRGESPGR